MPNFTANPLTPGQDWKTSSADPICKVGTFIATASGDKFRYVQAGAANLVQGTLLQAPAQIADHTNLAAQTAVIGATTMTLTLGATAVTLNQYADGQACFSNSAGAGYAPAILTHPATVLSGNVVVTLKNADALLVASNSTSRVDLVPNRYRGVVVAPTTKTGVAVGVARYPILAGEYGWIQSGGVAPLLIEGTPAAGDPVSRSANVAGAVGLATLAAQAANTATTAAIVGFIQNIGVDARTKPVLLIID